MKTKTHVANKAQKKAFDQVIKAIERAKKMGLVFYGKQWDLTAYTKQADDYVESIGFDRSLSGISQIPCLSKHILADSGADDLPKYKTQQDREKFNPDGL